MADILPIEIIRKLDDAILSGGLNTPAARDDLLSGINRGFVATLPDRNTAYDHIKSDLNELNGVPYLADNEVPLRIWLGNAVNRLKNSGRVEREVFQNALDTLDEVTNRLARLKVAKPKLPYGSYFLMDYEPQVEKLTKDLTGVKNSRSCLRVYVVRTAMKHGDLEFID